MIRTLTTNLPFANQASSSSRGLWRVEKLRRTSDRKDFQLNSRATLNAPLLYVELNGSEVLILGTIETPHLSPLPFSKVRGGEKARAFQLHFY